MPQDTQISAQDDGRVAVGKATNVDTSEPIPTTDEAFPDRVQRMAPACDNDVKLPGDEPKAPADAAGFPTVLPEIVEKARDPNCPPDEISRLITLEMALVATEQARVSAGLRNDKFALENCKKDYEGRMKTLNMISRSLNTTEFAKRRDILNFDGPKFVRIFGEFIDTVKGACQKALGRDNETMVQSIMRHLRDDMAVREPEWRRIAERQTADKAR